MGEVVVNSREGENVRKKKLCESNGKSDYLKEKRLIHKVIKKDILYFLLLNYKITL